MQAWLIAGLILCAVQLVGCNAVPVPVPSVTSEVPATSTATPCRDTPGPLKLAGVALGESVAPLLKQLGEPVAVSGPDRYGAMLYEYPHMLILAGEKSMGLRGLDIKTGADVREIFPGLNLGATKEAAWSRLVSLGVCPHDKNSADYAMIRNGEQLILEFKDGILRNARLTPVGM